MHDAGQIHPKSDVREFRDAAGTLVRLEIPPPGEGESVFVMAGHKAGSTLLQGILRILSTRAGKPLLSIDSQMFNQGYPVMKAPPAVFDIWKQPGYIFGGIRAFNPYFDTPEFRRDARKILLVRDPRDIATSLYFSQAKSHAAPGAGKLTESFAKTRQVAQSTEINDYILKGKTDSVLNPMVSFSRLLGSQKLNLFRYEDIIFNKREWVLEIGRILQMKIPDQMLERILAQYDIVPSTEDASKHVRQVKPGNFTKHLSPAAIKYIQTKYAGLFEVFRYDLA